MSASFTDCCVRYGQENVYTRFSQGQMTLGEIYMALIYGLIDPACLPSMAIIHHQNKTWCTDTRRLTLAKQLEREGKWEMLNSMRIHRVESSTPQYRDFVTHRLPALQRRGFDGLTVHVSDRRGPTCCFDHHHRFRSDLEEHIIKDHLTHINLREFSDLTHFHCDRCQKATRLTCTKSAKASFYTMIRKCGCQPKIAHRCSKPWLTMTLSDLCNEYRRYKNERIQPTSIAKPAISQTNSLPRASEKCSQIQKIPSPSISVPSKIVIPVRTPSIAIRILPEVEHDQRPLIPIVCTSITAGPKKHADRKKHSRCTIS